MINAAQQQQQQQQQKERHRGIAGDRLTGQP
jgi:hypothetical protein